MLAKMEPVISFDKPHPADPATAALHEAAPAAPAKRKAAPKKKPAPKSR
jgi:hypothetical protein